jgi:hypothetical protein
MATDDRVTWIEGTEGCWRMGLCDPIPRLAGCVKALTWYGERWPWPVARRQVATSGAVLFVTWGTPLEVSLGGSSSSFSAFVAGVADRPALTPHAGTQDGIGVHLSALGVSRLLGVAGAELANRCVALDEVLGRDAEALMERLWGAATASRRVAMVEAALVERLGAGPILSPEVVWAWEKLCCQPLAHVAELAAEVGWSRTRLASPSRSGSHRSASLGSSASKGLAGFWPKARPRSPRSLPALATTTRRASAATCLPWPAALPRSWLPSSVRVGLQTRDIRPRQPRRCCLILAEVNERTVAPVPAHAAASRRWPLTPSWPRSAGTVACASLPACPVRHRASTATCWHSPASSTHRHIWASATPTATN